MALFAPVVPLGLAKWLKEKKALGNYHLLLAHDVIEHPKEYAEVYGDIGRDRDSCIIMDNSLIELGYAIDTSMLIDACHIVGARYAVMPDKLKEADQTYDMSEKGFKELFKKAPEIKPVFVVQGANIMQCLELSVRFLKLADIHGINYMLSVPRVLGDTLGSRKELIASIWKQGVPMHLLGFSNNLLDDVACSRMPGVVGIDSASPIRVALQRKSPLTLDWPIDPGPRGDYWTTNWLEFMESWPHVEGLVLDNIQKVRTWIADHHQRSFHYL